MDWTHHLATAMLAVASLSAGTAPASAGPLVLASGGRPKAPIVVARQPSAVAEFAAAELQGHVRRVTGALLLIVRDDARVTGNRILVGESAATRALGLTSRSFKPQEYLIRADARTLVLMGRDNPGAATTGPARVTGQPARVPGRQGLAVRFDGAHDALTVEQNGFSDEAGTLALWAWIPAKAHETEATLLRLDGANPWSYHILRHVGRGVTYVTYDGEKGSSVASGELAEGWHHIVATHDRRAARIELFVDGASQGVAPFTRSTCAGSPLLIGGIPGDGKVGNPFAGMVDDVVVSTAVCAPQTLTAGKPAPGATLLLRFDEPKAPYRDSSGVARVPDPPGAYDEQGTCYAVYDFLERCCGVRWFAPGEVGMVCPSRPALSVASLNVRRSPAFRFRQGTYLPVYGILKELWENPNPAEVRLYACRMRLGGQQYAANHSFYGYYDRFWKVNPERRDLSEAEHPDWFAKGYAGQPPQMCFTDPGFVAQVVQDARDYFDGKGAKPGAQANGDFFALVPMDNSSWCKCPACVAQLDPSEEKSPHFSNGWASDYIFGFANQVAREIRKSHPGKYLATLAYSSYAYYPKHTRLESNIAVQLCLHVRNWWSPAMEKNDTAFYRSWTTKEKDRPIYLWLYYCFPEEIATNGGWNAFPGFFAHTVDRQFKMFAKDGVRGVFLNNLGDYLDTYATLKYLDDPSRSIDRLIGEFHTLYYGAAAAPMKKLYLRIEETYSNPAYYSEAVRNGVGHAHQTEDMAWGSLGTEARMAEFGALMDEAKRLARTDMEKRRVALFERGIWRYMVEGRAKWVAKQPH